jgi:hypothetical protein
MVFSLNRQRGCTADAFRRLRRGLQATTLALTLALTFATFGVTEAQAAPPSGAASGASAEAYNKKFKEALDLLKKRRFDSARTKLLELLSIEQKPGVLYNIATAESELNLNVDALTHYREYLAHPNAKADLRAEVQKTLFPAVYKKTGHLYVTADPGDEVFVGGRSQGKAPITREIDLVPGPTRVGVAGREVDLEAKAGIVARIDLRKSAKREESEVDKQLRSMPGGEDGPKAAKPKDKGGGLSGLSVLGIVTGGVGLALIGGGVFAAISATQSAGVADKQRAALNPKGNDTSRCLPPFAGEQKCLDLKNTNDERVLKANLGLAFLIGGGALTTAGIIMLVAGGNSKEKGAEKGAEPSSDRQTKLTPWVGPGTGGISVSGSFF